MTSHLRYGILAVVSLPLFVCGFNVLDLYSVGTTVGVIVSVNSKSNSVTADSISVGLE